MCANYDVSNLKFDPYLYVNTIVLSVLISDAGLSCYVSFSLTYKQMLLCVNNLSTILHLKRVVSTAVVRPMHALLNIKYVVYNEHSTHFN